MPKNAADSAFTKTARRIEAERNRAAAAAESAKKRHTAQLEKAERLARKAAAVGKLSTQAAEAAQLLAEFPDLARPYLEEFGGMAMQKTGPQPPNGAAMKAAMQTVLDQVADRFDELENSDLCSVDESDREELDQWQPTRAEIEFVKLFFFRELFAARPKPEKATDTAPGSIDRVEAMAARAAAGEDIYHHEDAKGDGRKVKTKERANGGGMQILGWDEGDGDVGAGADAEVDTEKLSLRDEAAREAEKIRTRATGRGGKG